VKRRTFLGVAGALVLGDAAAPAAASFPIIDTHIHLGDPSRMFRGMPARQGPPPGAARRGGLFTEPTLPARYRRVVAEPLGISGAIEIEASPSIDENQWVLDVSEPDTIIVGTVGNLDPAAADFGQQLDRYHKHPLFRGIRYGNLWGRNPSAAVEKPEFIAGLKALAGADLSLDSANPNLDLLEALLKISDRVPTLRIIVDHLPQMTMPTDAAGQARNASVMREFHKRPQVYVKVSEVFRNVDGKIPEDVGFYRPRLDEIYETFGENRVLYGSDWPNSEHWLSPEAGLKLVREYFMAKGQAVAEKYFWKNSAKAYKWARRASGQPDPKTA
jgi:predicted TIM-barrel fold metal-dependent hydrolase